MFLLALLLTVFIQATDCNCARIEDPVKAVSDEFVHVDHVLIGEVISFNSDSSQYVFIAREVFKGNFKLGHEIVGVNSGACEPFITRPGEWLLFGSCSDLFVANSCGMSLNLENPWRKLPPPPPPEVARSLGSDWLDKWKAKQKDELQVYLTIVRDK